MTEPHGNEDLRSSRKPKRAPAPPRDDSPEIRSLNSKLEQNDHQTKPNGKVDYDVMSQGRISQLDAAVQPGATTQPGAVASTPDSAYERRLKAKLQGSEKVGVTRVQKGLDDFERKLKAKMEQNDIQKKPSDKVDYDARLNAGATTRPGAVASTPDNAYERRLKAKLEGNEKVGVTRVQKGLDDFERKLKAKMEQNDTQTKPSSKVDYDERLKAKMMGENRRSSNNGNDFNEMGNERPTQPGVAQAGATTQPGAVSSTLDNAYERRLKAKLQGNEKVGVTKVQKGLDNFERKLKAKMEQNDTQTKPSGQVDYDERLKAKMMGENIRSSNTDNDFNKMGNQRPTQLGATAQPGAVAGTLDNAFERRLKAKLQEREQPSNPKTSSKADEYDKRIKAKLQENEQARKPKTTKRVDDYDRRLKAKMQQNEEALRTNKGIDASRSKINERVDYDTKLKEKMMKENRNSSVLDKNYDEMGKHQPDPADNYYESKFESLANKNNDRSRDDEEYFSRLNRKVQENEKALGLNSSDQNNDEMDPVSKNTEFDYDYEEDYQNTSADVGNTYDMEMEAQVQNQTVMVGDHGRAVAPEPQYGQTPGAPVVGGIAGDDQLAVAIAIEEEEDEYYQSATIYDPAAKPPFLKNRRFRLYAGSGLCVCLAMTALIITSIILFREQLVPPVPEIDLDRGAIWEAQMKEDNIDIEKWFIQFESAVPSASNTMSIAHRAARWIISEDPMKLNSYAGNLIQRYLLALFYFTTTNDGERPWRSCNKPKSDENSTCIHERFSRVANDTITYEPDDAIRWMSEEHECNWVGNICDDNLKLRALHVMAQNITGTIPEDLVNLSLLQSLRLAYNNFTGPLPIVYASMRQLLSLEVHGNNLTGTLPSEYFSATLLQTLNIIDNKFTGTISNDIGKLENLKGLHLADNYFTGTIPSDIFKLEYLAFLQLQENIFHGTIPTEIGNMLQLQEFRCEANQLTGPLPSEIGLMNNLVDFRASLNKMTGTLPNELYTNSYLGRLELYSNYFSGTLDPRISQLKELTYLYLSRNQFTGNMTSLESLYRLKLAWLHLNQFEGSLPEKMCDKSQRQIEILQTDCFPLKTPPNACPCCSACCDRSTEICLIMDDDLKYNFF